ncbi:MAG: hypothetical protein Q8P59_11875 [Dehalococcoidia bacterium]|nr:hypothetical protein [Dehalococcoidia bacterium]
MDPLEGTDIVTFSRGRLVGVGLGTEVTSGERAALGGAVGVITGADVTHPCAKANTKPTIAIVTIMRDFTVPSSLLLKDFTFLPPLMWPTTQ